MSAPITFPAVLKVNTGRVVLLSLAALLLAALGTLLFVFAMLERHIGMFAFGAVLLALALLGVLGMRDRLVLDDQALTLRRPWGTKRYPWQDMESIFLNDGGGVKLIGINLRSGTEPGFFRQLTRATGADISFPARFGGLKPDGLLEVLHAGWRAGLPGEALNPAQRFALALGGIYAHVNQERHDMLRGGQQSAALKQMTSATLADFWGVTDTDSANDALAWLTKGGHRAEYAEMREAIGTQPLPEDPLDLLAPEATQNMTREDKDDFRRRARFVAMHGGKLPHIAAWDHVRQIMVARMAVGAGYLSEPDAWRWILHAAECIKAQFHDWHSLADNFLAGRKYWGGEDSQQAFELAVRHLLEDAASPWKATPWPTA